MTGKVERGIPSEELAPGKIPKWHVRYKPALVSELINTDGELESLRKEWEKRFRAKAKLVVSDMGEVVIIFSPDSRYKK